MNSNFEVEKATLQDVHSMASIVSSAWAKDALWQAIMNDTTIESEQEFCRRWLEKDFSIPGTLGFKILDPEKGQVARISTYWFRELTFFRNMIAWTRLGTPAILTPSEQVIKNTHVPLLAGMNETLFAFLEASTQGEAYAKLGFNKERDFMRQGTYVDLRYQRQGLAARLARHLNTIADERQAVTWGAAGPAIVKLMPRQGFEMVQQVKPKELKGASICIMRRNPKRTGFGEK
jgi:GNAT superfamily N-acetyltransferase